MANQHARKLPLEVLALTLVTGLAALLLLWNLGEKYLWQDEAATAVLAERMLQYGTPRAYDGVNLITIDHIAAEDIQSLDQRTTNAQAVVDYYIKRGDLKADTTWKWHPWGQFVVAAASLKLLGRTTVAARLPFALAGIVTVLALYGLVRKYCASPLMAALAALLLAGNAYWILHARQCRYYPLSSLFLVLTLLGYTRWQSGGRWGTAAFIAAAWCWFQVDYGTVWPVLGVLFLDAGAAHWRNLRSPLAVGAVLAAAIAPFIYYYEMWGRKSLAVGTWGGRFLDNLCNVNQYVVPALIVLAAAALLARRQRRLPAIERRLVVISCAIILALLLWVPMVAPSAFVRYVIVVAPVGCLLSAWVLVRGCGTRAPQFAWLGALILLLTPWFCMLLPPPKLGNVDVGVRTELLRLISDVFDHRADPNRLVIDWLKEHAAPTDEILINYEDVPLMFYLPNPIRGGLADFRVEDDSRMPPRFAVLRRSVLATYWTPYTREIARYEWETEPVNIPDVFVGNNPDPLGQIANPATAPSLTIARRMDGKNRE